MGGRGARAPPPPILGRARQLVFFVRAMCLRTFVTLKYKIPARLRRTVHLDISLFTLHYLHTGNLCKKGLGHGFEICFQSDLPPPALLKKTGDVDSPAHSSGLECLQLYRRSRYLSMAVKAVNKKRAGRSKDWAPTKEADSQTGSPS